MDYKIIVFALLGLFFLGFAVSTTFFTPKKCSSIECFKEKMEKCQMTYFIHDSADATWKYSIKGLDEKECVIKVTLLQPKKGNIAIEKLSGLDMECRTPKGFFYYPEKDLSKCHGRLKEEFQTIVINKLHKYILQNLGKIEEELYNLTSSE